MRNPAGWYRLYYCHLREFFRTGPANWAFESKAVITLLALEVWLLVSISVYVVARWSLPAPSMSAAIALPLVALLYFGNHLVLFRNDRWKTYDEIRRQFSRPERVRTNILVVLVTLLIPTICVLLLLRAGAISGK